MRTHREDTNQEIFVSVRTRHEHRYVADADFRSALAFPGNSTSKRGSWSTSNPKWLVRRYDQNMKTARYHLGTRMRIIRGCFRSSSQLRRGQIDFMSLGVQGHGSSTPLGREVSEHRVLIRTVLPHNRQCSLAIRRENQLINRIVGSGVRSIPDC